MELDVQIEIAARRFAGTNIAVINVMFPPSPVSETEVETFSTETLQITEGPDGTLVLACDGDQLVTLDSRNGTVPAFQRLLDATGVFVLSMITTSQDEGTFLARTLMAENGTGRIISDSGLVRASAAEMEEARTDAIGAEEVYNGVVLEDTADLASYLDITQRGAAARTLDPRKAN